MSRLLGVLTVVGVFLLWAPVLDAYAQAPKKGAKTEEKVREMDFEGDVVEATFLRPDQGVAEALVRRSKSSLIQVRTDFVDEILRSAEDL